MMLPRVLVGWLLLGAIASASAVDVTVEEFMFQGHPVRLESVPEPRALLFVFHGSGGGIGFVTRDVTREAIVPLQRAGYVLVATESTQREPPRRWNARDADVAANADLERLLALSRHLADERGLALPVFTMGMSNGAFMAMLFATVAADAGVPVRAVAAHQGGAAGAVLQQRGYRVPTFYVLVQNDHLVDNERVISGCAHLQRQDLACEVHRVVETALTPRHLEREGLSSDVAERVFVQLRDVGVIDASGIRRVVLDGNPDREVWQQRLRAAGISEPGPVFDGMRQAWAVHLMRREFGELQLAFFERALSAD